MRKTVRVSLGALEPGSYLVVAGGRTARLGVTGAQAASASCALRTAPLMAIASRFPGSSGRGC